MVLSRFHRERLCGPCASVFLRPAELQCSDYPGDVNSQSEILRCQIIRAEGFGDDAGRMEKCPTDRLNKVRTSFAMSEEFLEGKISSEISVGRSHNEKAPATMWRTLPAMRKRLQQCGGARNNVGALPTMCLESQQCWE